MLTYFQRKFLEQDVTRKQVAAYLKLNNDYRDHVSTINLETNEISTKPTVGGVGVAKENTESWIAKNLIDNPPSEEDLQSVLDAQATSKQCILQRDCDLLRVNHTANLAFITNFISSRDEELLLDMADSNSVVGEPAEDLAKCVRDVLDYAEEAAKDEHMSESGIINEELPSRLYREGFNGILLEVSTPVRNSGGSFSWGYCHIGYVYANSYDKAIDLAVEWSNEQWNHSND